MTLQAHNLACVRGDRQLFSNVNCEIKAGEALWISGENGSGKTSLLRLLCGLSTPFVGEVRWHGRDIRRLREEFFKELLYCGHASGVKDDLTALENIRIGTRLSGQHCSTERAYRALDQLGLASVADFPARSLSQGQRKRLTLARLLTHDAPVLLILDEPFTALDRQATNVLSSMLNQHLSQGSVVICTTHHELAIEANRLQRLNLGEVRCSIH